MSVVQLRRSLFGPIRTEQSGFAVLIKPREVYHDSVVNSWLNYAFATQIFRTTHGVAVSEARLASSDTGYIPPSKTKTF